jgi:Type IIB DNA topoisomerase
MILGEGKLVTQRELFYRLLSDSPQYFKSQQQVNSTIQGTVLCSPIIPFHVNYKTKSCKIGSDTDTHVIDYDICQIFCLTDKILSNFELNRSLLCSNTYKAA